MYMLQLHGGKNTYLLVKQLKQQLPQMSKASEPTCISNYSHAVHMQPAPACLVTVSRITTAE